MGTRSAGYSAVQPPFPHYCTSIPSPRRTAQVHTARPIRLMARRTKLSQPVLSAGFGLKMRRHGVGKTLEQGSEFWVGWLLGELCADDDSLVSRIPRITTNTHCHSGNISKMHDFSEIMENGFHVLDYPVLARLLLDGGHEG